MTAGGGRLFPDTTTHPTLEPLHSSGIIIIRMGIPSTVTSYGRCRFPGHPAAVTPSPARHRPPSSRGRGRRRFAAVGEHVGVVAAGFFERVGQDGQQGEVAGVVGGASERDRRLGPPRGSNATGRNGLPKMSRMNIHDLRRTGRERINRIRNIGEPVLLASVAATCYKFDCGIERIGIPRIMPRWNGPSDVLSTGVRRATMLSPCP